jgi:adenosylcobinamide-GDP ribazoletransferase
VSARLREAQLACMILTRLPVGRIEGTTPPLASTVWTFPLVGAGVGLISGLVFVAASGLGLPALAAALLALATGAVVTGGLHEDGLADTADGFGGGRTLSRKLEIMRDSRIGSYGVLALIFVLGLTASGISAAGTLWGFVTIGAASRAAMLLPIIALDPAREDGLGRSASTALGPAAWTALAIALVLCIAGGYLAAALVVFLTSSCMTLLARRQIGGQTGDVLGATQKLGECAAWLTVAALA